MYGQQEQKKFPYELKLNTEIITISSGLTLNLSYRLLKESNYVNHISESTLYSLNNKQINSFDRISTEYWSPEYSDYSDYTRNALRYAPALFAIPYLKNKSWNQIITLGLIYAEGYYITSGITRLSKILVQRKRPYLYNNTSIPESEKIELSKEDNSYFSFFSGHTSSAFYSATFISKAYYDIYGPTNWFYIVTALSYTTSTSVAYFRVRAGKHYPSDVITGALAGTLIGYLIPELHKTKNSNLTVYMAPNNGIGLIYQF